jgi:hypothetical protein
VHFFIRSDGLLDEFSEDNNYTRDEKHFSPVVYGVIKYISNQEYFEPSFDVQGDSYSIIQTLTGGRFQPPDTLTKMSRF